MAESLPRVYLARHGETRWSLSGQHAGRIDLPLTAHGEANARRLGGAYEGKTQAQIRSERPGWEIFRDGCPEGESLSQVAARADRVVARLRAIAKDVLVFSSRHLLQVLAARWLGLDATLGCYLLLDTTAVSVRAYQRDLTEPAVRLWNDHRHLHDARGIE